MSEHKPSYPDEADNSTGFSGLDTGRDFFSQNDFNSYDFSDDPLESLGGYQPEPSFPPLCYNPPTQQNPASYPPVKEEAPPVKNTLTYEATKDIQPPDPPAKPVPFHYEPTESDYKKKRAERWTMLFIFLFFGLAMIGGMVAVLYSSYYQQKEFDSFLANARTVNADILSINQVKTSKSNTRQASIGYTINGQYYKPRKTFSVDGSTTTKSKLQVLVSTSNPYDCRARSEVRENIWNNTVGVAWVVISFGVVMILIDFISFIRFMRNPRHLRYYRKEMDQAKAAARKQQRNAARNGNRSAGTSRYSNSSSGQSERSDSSSSVWKTEFGSSVSNTDATGTSKKKYIPKKPTRKQFRNTGISFVVIGTIWMAGFLTPAGIIIGQKEDHKRFMQHAVPCQAEVISTRDVKHTSTNKKSHSTSTHWNYYAMVKYTYGETTYVRGEFEVQPSEAQQGKIVTVYIDPDNPGDCRVNPIKDDQTYYIVILCSIAAWGIVFIVIGAIILVKHRKRIQRNYYDR